MTKLRSAASAVAFRTPAQLALGAAAAMQILSACASEAPLGSADDDLDASATSAAEQPVIVGDLQWFDVSTLPAGGAERQNAAAVGILELPATESRCTGFLIAPDVIMTNAHCASRASEAAGAKISFGYQTGSTSLLQYDCSTFVGADVVLDYALLRCAGRPGDSLGVLELTSSKAASSSSVYVVQQNCDYYTDPQCLPTKKLARGRVTSNRASSTEIAHDADTLGGSSGSPVFSADHTVIALHHAGLGTGSNGRGSSNLAVEMRLIVPKLQSLYPSLQLGAQAPVDDPTTPTGPSTPTNPGVNDANEPNNAQAQAKRIGIPATVADQVIGVGDEDWFAFTAGAATRTIRIDFDHNVGDLDLYLYDRTGRLLFKSEGQTDSEVITRALPSGTISIRVVGYNGGTGSYTLQVQ